MATHHITKKKSAFKLTARQINRIGKAEELLRQVQAELFKDADTIDDPAAKRVFERLSDAAQYAKSAMKD